MLDVFSCLQIFYYIETKNVMKGFFYVFLFSLLAPCSYTQNPYTIEKEAQLFDLTAGEFMTVNLRNSKSHRKHYSSAGNILWEDSIEFMSVQNSVHFHSLTRFKDTDSYIVVMYNDQTPNYADFSANDTLIYQFTWLDLSGHQFTYNRIDTLYTRGCMFLSVSDSTIYLFSNDLSYNFGGKIGINTYSLSSDFGFEQVSTYASNQIFSGWNTKYYKTGDSLAIYQFTGDMNYLTFYNSSMLESIQNYHDVNMVAGYEQVKFREVFDNDSVLIVSEESIPGSLNRKWKFEWLNYSLLTISSLMIDAPLTPTPLLRYRIGSWGVKVDNINKVIYVLATEVVTSSGLGADNQHLFIYDFDFNLVCDFPIIYGNDEINTLTSINDLVYLRVDYQEETRLYPLSCQILDSENQEGDYKLIIYPNPSDGDLTLFFSDTNLGVVDIEIVDLTGSHVDEHKFYIDSSTIQFNIGELNKGVYILKILVNSEFIGSHRVVLN
jgi:hypothetical protein